MAPAGSAHALTLRREPLTPLIMGSPGQCPISETLKFVVMIGVNELGRRAKEDEVCGNVSELLDRLADQLPSSCVVLMGALPAGNVDDGHVVSLNARYGDFVESRPGVSFLDLHDKYLDDGGERDTSLYDDDGVHLNGPGYRIWIDTIPVLL